MSGGVALKKFNVGLFSSIAIIHSRERARQICVTQKATGSSADERDPPKVEDIGSTPIR
jgi:hypothetical protein